FQAEDGIRDYKVTGVQTCALPISKQRFNRMEGILRVIGPDATLRRGYSITLDECGTIVRTVAAVRPKMKIRTRVSDGEFGSEVRSEERRVGKECKGGSVRCMESEV